LRSIAKAASAYQDFTTNDHSCNTDFFEQILGGKIMKRKIAFFLASLMLLCSVGSAFGVGNVSFQNFVYYFSFYGGLFGTGHSIVLEKVDEIWTHGSTTSCKVIFNDCEILTVNVDSASMNVTSVHCTWSRYPAGAKNYADDFYYLLVESLLAVGVNNTSAMDVLDIVGFSRAMSDGDSGEAVMDGFRVSYSVSKDLGISFVIEPK
jgi:hypothetical protein